MRPGSHLEIYLIIGLSAVISIASLIFLPGDRVIPILLKAGEIYAIMMLLLLGFYSWRILWSDTMGLPARLAFFALVGAAAGGVYWTLTYFGLSARPARFIVWGLLLAVLLGLLYLDFRHESPEKPNEPESEP